MLHIRYINVFPAPLSPSYINYLIFNKTCFLALINQIKMLMGFFIICLVGSIWFSPFFQIRKKCLFFASWWWRSYLLLWFSYFHHDFYISLRKDATWQIVFRSAVFSFKMFLPYMKFSLFWIYFLLHISPVISYLLLIYWGIFTPIFFILRLKYLFFEKQMLSCTFWSDDLFFIYNSWISIKKIYFYSENWF